MKEPEKAKENFLTTLLTKIFYISSNISKPLKYKEPTTENVVTLEKKNLSY
jgi:hypothetical protein